MLKQFLFGLSFLLLCSVLSAQVTIFGQVTFGQEDGPGVPGWPVEVFFSDGTQVGEIITNDDGSYEQLIETSLGDPEGIEVRTQDICTGDFISVLFDIAPDQVAYEINLTICGGIDPPPPTECAPYFYYEQVPSDEGFAVHFFDVSYPGEEGIDSWSWSFGDGGVSDEQNPAHVYSEAGEYEVLLTITGQDCEATIVQVVTVYDDENCDCPTDEYDPVCVFTPSGAVLEFVSPCFAECAGYGPDVYTSCEGNECGCPEFYAPVCVMTPDGVTTQFQNHCFAECEGYGPDQWMDCESECNCPTDEYDPVCVITPFGEVIEFTTACYAECAGFEPGQYQPCDGGCVCPEFYDPVCVTLDDGTVLTFSNFCFAQCEGYGPDQWEDCENECECPQDLFDPVCVATPTGIILTFINPCEAECEGYGPDVYYHCDGNECNCPEYLDPVCVLDDLGNVITFDNPCFAECAGYGPDQFLECENECGCEDGGTPVCVGTPFGVINFPNTCFAECAGYGPATWLDGCGESCFCDDVWDPVCVVTDEGYNFTFANPCEAACYGFDVFVDCEEECVCPQVYEPVCVTDPATGESIEFINACYAECEGYGPDQYEDCNETCNCPAVWDPVCVNGFAGIITFPNACYAECEGFGPEYYVDCEEDCVCDTVWDPVCVATPDGSIITFSNACMAECEGFTPDQFVDCGDCTCDDYYLPVCVIDPATGDFIEFINPCYAICAGYGADDIFPCDNGNECYADFSYLFYDDAELGHRVTFTDQSFTLGGITSWFWDFGDGATSTEQNPEHIYEVAGVYDVTLVIEGPECGTLSTTYHLCVGDGGGVGGPACQGFFFFEQPNADDLLSYQFIDFSLGDINAWIWDFGDGTTSTAQNPTHTYATEGVYVVSLTVISDDCESSIQIALTAGTNVWYGDLECRAWFLPIINPATLEVYFINLSSPDAVQFEWDFGDGTVSMDPLAFHSYAESGTYTVTLTTTSANGCTNTFSVTINLSGEDDGFTSNPVFSLISSTQEVVALKNLSAAPNPTSSTVQLNWESEKVGDYSWQLFDLNGKLLQQQSLRSNGGLNNLEIDLSRQPAGIYLFRLQTSEGQKTLRLSKL
jgi:PKD repeat protein